MLRKKFEKLNILMECNFAWKWKTGNFLKLNTKRAVKQRREQVLEIFNKERILWTFFFHVWSLPCSRRLLGFHHWGTGALPRR